MSYAPSDRRPKLSWAKQRSDSQRAAASSTQSELDGTTTAPSAALRTLLKRRHTSDLDVESMPAGAFSTQDLYSFGEFLDADKPCPACGTVAGPGWVCGCGEEVGICCFTAEVMCDFRKSMKAGLQESQRFCVHAQSLALEHHADQLQSVQSALETAAVQHLNKHYDTLQLKLANLREWLGKADSVTTAPDKDSGVMTLPDDLPVELRQRLQSFADVRRQPALQNLYSQLSGLGWQPGSTPPTAATASGIAGAAAGAGRDDLKGRFLQVSAETLYRVVSTWLTRKQTRCACVEEYTLCARCPTHGGPCYRASRRTSFIKPETEMQLLPRVNARPRIGDRRDMKKEPLGLCHFLVAAPVQGTVSSNGETKFVASQIEDLVQAKNLSMPVFGCLGNLCPERFLV
jgi:hypothetical protein